MGGSSPTVGYNYRLVWFDGLALGPWDALTEFRGADKQAWKGRVEVNTALAVYAPKLWGGDQDQGGVDGTLTPMFGRADQVPHPTLVSIFGPKISAHRGMMNAVWTGIWGANNPFQQKRSYRGERTYSGWDNDDCWYPETVRVPIEGEFTPGTPGAGTYRWAMKHNAYVAASPDGIDWSDTTALTPGAGSEVNFGNYIVSTAPNGDTAYALYTAPGTWIPGPNVGATAMLFCRVCVVNGEIWHAKGTAGYAHASNPAGPYTLGEGRTWLVAGNADYIVRYAGANQVFYTDGFWFYRSADGGTTWEHVSSLELGGEGDDDYYFYLDASASSDSKLAFAGADYGGNTKVYWSTDGFATKSESTMPAGQQGQVRELLHVGGSEWLAFVYGGTCDDGPSAVLRSTDDLVSFQTADLGLADTVTFAHQFQGNAAVDRVTGQVVFVADPDGGGAHAYESPDRTTWQDVPLTFNPETVYLIGPNDPGTPPYYGRIAKNPAHMILWAHTQQHCGRQLRETVDLDQLTTQADWFYERGFGLCWVRNPKEESPREFIKRIERVAGCSFTLSLDDGLWHLDVANGVYDLESLPVITDNDVVSFKETATTLDNAVNSVSIKYFDPELNESIITPPLRAMGLIAQFGEIHQTFEYPEVPIARIALEIRARELLARTTPTRGFELVCRPTIYRLRKNQYVRLQLPKRGIADMVCLVGEIPTSGKLKSGNFEVTLTQDIYSLPSTVYGGIELGEDNSPPKEPVQIDQKAVFEAPYIDVVASMPAADFDALPEDAGYVVAAASNPGRMRNFTMMVAPDGGDFDEVDEGEFCPSCTLTGDIEPGLRIGIGYEAGRNMAAVRVGTVGTLNGELVRVDAHDIEAMTLDLGRGCGDTLPRKHDAGDVILFYQVANAYDRTQHIAGETVQVKLLTNSVTKQMPEVDAEATDVTFVERLARPYNNGDMKMNGVSIFAVGTSTPGGGGGGGGGSGGGGGVEHPVRIGPGGVPLSPVPGPNGGFPDDAPYPIPQPTTIDTDIMPGGGFDDPADLALWRKQDGSALGPEWSLVDGELTYSGASGAAYCYGIRLSLPIMPFPRYSATVTAKITTTRGMLARFGVGWGSAMIPVYIDAIAGESDIQERGTDYPDQTEVTHTFELPVTQAAGHGSSKYNVITFMPAVEFVSESFAPSIGKVDDVTMSISRLVPDATDLTPTNLDFSDGLDGWIMYADPTGNPYAPIINVAGGVVSVTGTSQFFDELRLICADPITDAFEIGKYFGMGAEVWSDDDTLYGSDANGWITAGGVAFGYAVNRQDGSFALVYGSMAERGDWTPREMWQRCLSDAASLPPGWTIHALMTLCMSPGKTTKVRNPWCKMSNEVID